MVDWLRIERETLRLNDRIEQSRATLQMLQSNPSSSPDLQTSSTLWTESLGDEIRIVRVKNIGTVIIQQEKYHKNKVELKGSFRALFRGLERLEQLNDVLITHTELSKGKSEKERILILELCEK
jgi:hypothetical protein